MNVRRTAILLLAAVLVASCGATKPLGRADNKAASLHYQLGQVHFSDRDYPLALKELSMAVEIDPGNPDYHNLLGLTYYIGKKMYPEAVAHFNEALRLKPDFSEVHMNLGAVYLELKSWDKAIVQFEVVLKDIFFPNPEKAYNNLGWAYYGKGEYRKALANYTKALELNPRLAMAHNNTGLALYRMGKIEDAINSYKKAIGLFPGFLDANYNLGLALARQKDTAGALKAFERVVELAPGSDRARSAREYMDLIK